MCSLVPLTNLNLKAKLVGALLGMIRKIYEVKSKKRIFPCQRELILNRLLSHQVPIQLALRLLFPKLPNLR